MTIASDVNESVQALIERQVADGRQVGVQVCAYQNGERVVDAVAGVLGPDDRRPVARESLFLSWSTTKGVTATLAHILADQGRLDFDSPVARYWPMFGQNGKADVTVRQALSHQAGLHEMPRPFRIEHLTDWDAALHRMEVAAPAYPAGTAAGYHAFTWGWLVGGLLEAATGSRFGELMKSEIAEPLGVTDDMYVGIPDGVGDRLATTEIHTLGEGMAIPDDSELNKAIPPGIFECFNETAVRKACIPSANGHFTARALAKMYAALAMDGSVDGVRLMSPAQVAQMSELQTDRVDVVIGVPIRRSTGFTLGGEQGGISGPLGPRATAFGHSGAGGSIGFADPDIGLSVAVTLNKMSYPGPGQGVTLEICETIRSRVIGK